MDEGAAPEMKKGGGRTEGNGEQVSTSLETICLKLFNFEFSSLASRSLSRGLFIFTNRLCLYSKSTVAPSKPLASWPSLS